MDIVSHALWSGVVLGRKNKKRFIGVVIFSVLPDIFGEGIMFLFMFLGLDGMPSLENGHPNIADYPIYAQNFYNSSHSLVVFALAFLLIYMLNKKVYWPMLGWGLHILIDIPTHSIELFPTPFLQPISDFKIDGIPWSEPIILIPNIILLVCVYLVWLRKKISMR